MTRYSAEHKAATRRRIVDRAGVRLKTSGVDGSGLQTLMADAGLTTGAFYAHFESKEALVATVLLEQLERQRDGIDASDVSPADFVHRYLSSAHRDDVGGGCPTAALVDEVARAQPAVREAWTRGIVGVADAVARRVEAQGGDRPSTAAVLAAVAVLAGTLQLARAVTDPALSEALLRHGADNALAALGVTA